MQTLVVKSPFDKWTTSLDTLPQRYEDVDHEILNIIMDDEL
jgi:hypothetical protein